MNRPVLQFNVFIAILLCLAGCSKNGQPSVVVYTALDEMYAQELFDEFEGESGIRVRAVYDTEANKTTGLANRLVAERKRPRADVFWNNEVAQSIILMQKDVFESYPSSNAHAIPETYKDALGAWTGFAARGRVIVYNPGLTDAPPRKLEDFADP